MSKNKIEVIEAEKCVHMKIKRQTNMEAVVMALIDEGYKVTVNGIKEDHRHWDRIIAYDIEASEVVKVEVDNE